MAVGMFQVPTANNQQYTLNASYSAGGTSITLNQSVTGIVQAPGVCVIDRIDSAGNKTATKRTYYSFTGVSGANLTGLATVDGTDQAHSLGAIVEFVPDIVQFQAVYDTFNVEHSPSTGYHKSLASALNIQTNNIAVASTASLLLGNIQTLITNSLTGPSQASLNFLNIKTLFSASGASIVGLPSSASGSVLTSNDPLGYVFKPPASSSSGADGWTAVSDSWTYASASTITVPSGAASLYQVGDKIKLTQTTVKYFVLTAVADTLLTVAVNTSYTVANAAISAISYSHQENPIGYPHWFNVAAPTFDVTELDNASGGQPTIVDHRMRIDGRIVTVHIQGSGTKAGTNLWYWHWTNNTPAFANYSQRTAMGACYESSGDATDRVGSIVNISTNLYAMFNSTMADNLGIAQWGATYSYEI